MVRCARPPRARLPVLWPELRIPPVADKLIFDPVTGELVASSRQAAVNPQPAQQARPRHAEPLRATARHRTGSLAAELRSGDRQRTLAAIGRLAASPEGWDADTLVALAGLLASADDEIADCSARAAAFSGLHAAQVPILQQLVTRTGVVQLRALALVRDFGQQAVILADAAAALLESPDDTVGSAARDTLASIGLTPGALNEVTSLIRHRDAPVRLRCVDLLGALGARAAKAAGLLVLRMDDPVDAVRAGARAALLQVGFQPASLAEIGRMLNHARLERRLEMLDLLGRQGSAALQASPLVVDQLRAEQAEVRERAADTLKLIGLDDSCMRAIQQLAHHPTHGMRTTALELLEDCAVGPDAANLLLALMADRDVEVRDRAATALSRHDIRQGMLPALRKLLHDERWEVRTATLVMLERANERARPALRLIVERMEDANADVAKAAAAAFRAVGVADFCLPDIERLLNHRRQDRRLLMLGVLQRMGVQASATLPLVTQRLGDSDWVVREAACETFIAIGFDDSCLPEVRRLIQHQDREFRLAVIRALGACGLSAAAAAEFLDARQGDSDAEVGRAARTALRAVLRS